MYKVMLVDDDYPVLELLSEAVDWASLGLTLCSKHENGLAAWEQAQSEPPDILVTDIGMPKMDGLTLSAHMKELNPSVRIAILSCHSEFQYAQQAMRLNVQDYLLKDLLEPEDLEKLLAKFKSGLDGERLLRQEQVQMKHLVNETRELRKEKTFRDFIQQPMLSTADWRKTFGAFGLFEAGEQVLPVIGYLDNYGGIKHRFDSDQTLHFALSNVMEEMIGTLPLHTVHIGYTSRQSLLLFAFKPGIKTNVHDQVQQSLRRIGQTLEQVLKIKMSFLIGGSCEHPEKLKPTLCGLLGAVEQRFYLLPGEIARWQPGQVSGTGLFTLYDQASADIREPLMEKNETKLLANAAAWEKRMQGARYPSEEVRDWVLKLLIDLRLKLHALLVQPSSSSAETLHKEIAQFDSLLELFQWLKGQLRSFLHAREEGTPVSRRREITEAFQYVSLNLGQRISLEEVSAHLHMNPSYFSRFFKKETGYTFIEYVTCKKIERAKELLDQTNRPVNEICEMLGYDNQSYFIKTFKNQVGVTPTEYRG